MNIGGCNHPVNLVHRDDLIGITQELIRNRPEQNVFHAVSPDHPLKRSYYQEAAQYFDLIKPEFADDSSEGKLVLDTRSHHDLNYNYTFTSPSEMLATIQAP